MGQFVILYNQADKIALQSENTPIYFAAAMACYTAFTVTDLRGDKTGSVAGVVLRLDDHDLVRRRQAEGDRPTSADLQRERIGLLVDLDDTQFGVGHQA